MKKSLTVLLCALLLMSTVLVILPHATSDDFPEEEVPDPRGPLSYPPSISGFGIDYETGWNDTTFSFWLNFSSNEQPINVSVQVNIDSITYDMWENDTRDDNWIDGKDYFWQNDNRLWSKGLIPYYFHTGINGTENTTDTSYFEILNRVPYMLEPPFNYLEIDQEFEWEGRATDEDLDALNWTLEHNMTGDDWSEFEFIQTNTTSKIKIKCNQTFARWFNLTVFDYLDNEAYWNWTVYCNYTGGTNYYWTGAGDGYQWDDFNNWVIYSAGSYSAAVAGQYPNSNDDEAHINETADYIYLKDGANSVVTIGNLTLESGFTGTLNLSVDLIVDNANTKDGNITVNAGTLDTNGTANNQINLDGNLTVSATIDEQEGIVIVQGAQTQRISITNSQKLYKLTTDTSSTVGELYDNLTVFQITIGTGSTYKADANTRGYELWTNFTDAASCGFVSTSAGTLNLIGSGATGPGANITTADASPPPTNYWSGDMITGGADITMEWAYLDYGTMMQSDGSAAWDVENSTFDNFNGIYNVRIQSTATGITAFNNNTMSNGVRGLGLFGAAAGTDYSDLYNIVISSMSTADIVPWGSVNVEFIASNFDTSSVTLGAAASIISVDHNDVGGAYKIIIDTAWAKSEIVNDFATGDNIELVSGKFIVDEAAAAKTIQTESGTTLVIGKDTADASVTLTFDDINGAGFVTDETDGNLYINGTTTFPHTIRSANLPATSNGWIGWSSNWPAAGSITEVHNTTLYNTRSWSHGHEAYAEYSNVTFDAKNVNCGCSGQFTIWEPTVGSFFNDISINGTGGATEDAIYIMPDSVHVFLKNLVVTNFSGDDEVEIDEGTTGEVVHFRNSNFDETDFDFWGGGEECHWISQDHNDTANRYLTGVHATFNSSKSYVATGWDFTASDSVELIEGVLTIDENADATSFFIEESDAGIEVLDTYTFDLTTNLTNNGTLINNGTITDSGDYFNFYNTNPGGMWFNNSTVSNAKLAYYYDGFNFTVGNSANSTINDWTLEAPSGIDTDFNITYYDFSNKGSGVVWHMNATANSGSVYFGTNNLTAGQNYESYVDLVRYREHTADAGGWVNFSYNGWSTRHIYLIWVLGGPAPPSPGWSTPWLYKPVAFFEYEIFTFKFVNYIGEDRGRFGTTTPDDFTYLWNFGDGSESVNGINATHGYSFFLIRSYNVKLTVCEIGEDKCDSYEEEVLLIDWPMIGLIIMVFAVLVIAVVSKRYRIREIE